MFAEPIILKLGAREGTRGSYTNGRRGSAEHNLEIIALHVGCGGASVPRIRPLSYKSPIQITRSLAKNP